MSVGISLAVITAAVVALVVFLIISLLKLNRLVDRTSFLVDHLNQDLPGLLADLRNASANINALSDNLAQGVFRVTAAASEGAEYIKNFKFFGTIFDILTMARRVIRFIGKLVKRS